MILDAKLELSDAQAETTIAAHDSDNVIDFGIADPNIGEGTSIMLYVVVNTTVTSGGAGTVAVSLEDSPDNSTWTQRYTTPALAKATLVQGYEIIAMPLPDDIQRYVKVVYTIGTAALTAGKFDAYLSLG